MPEFTGVVAADDAGRVHFHYPGETGIVCASPDVLEDLVSEFDSRGLFPATLWGEKSPDDPRGCTWIVTEWETAPVGRLSSGENKPVGDVLAALEARGDDGDAPDSEKAVDGPGVVQTAVSSVKRNPTGWLALAGLLGGLWWVSRSQGPREW